MKYTNKYFLNFIKILAGVELVNPAHNMALLVGQILP